MAAIVGPSSFAIGSPREGPCRSAATVGAELNIFILLLFVLLEKLCAIWISRHRPAKRARAKRVVILKAASFLQAKPGFAMVAAIF